MRMMYLAPFAAIGLAACGGGTEQTIVGEDGEEVTVTREDGNTVTYTTEDGQATVTTNSDGDTATGGLPAYPGANSQGGINIDASGENGGSGQMRSFQTSDSPEEVIAFYRQALEARGYDIQMTMNSGQHQAITANRGGGEEGVHITATDMGGQGTNVAIIAGGG